MTYQKAQLIHNRNLAEG